MLYKNTYRISTNRLANYDYGSNGLYFVTICTKDQEYFFGDIFVETQNFVSLQPTEMGKIARQFWTEVPKHFPFVELDEFIVMPNHLHGILFFNKPDNRTWRENKFGPQSQNLASVIRGYKAGVKKYATMNNLNFAWQPRY